MANLPATGYISNATRTNAEQQTALEAQRDWLSVLHDLFMKTLQRNE